MVDFLVRKTLDPIIEESTRLKDLRVLDPACGGGNFLTPAFDYLFRAYRRTTGAGDLAKLLLERVLIGYDLDPVLAEVARASLLLQAVRATSHHERLQPLVFGGATGDERGFLALPSGTGALAALSGSKRKAILTNPPFMGRRLHEPLT